MRLRTELLWGAGLGLVISGLIALVSALFGWDESLAWSLTRGVIIGNALGAFNYWLKRDSFD